MGKNRVGPCGDTSTGDRGDIRISPLSDPIRCSHVQTLPLHGYCAVPSRRPAVQRSAINAAGRTSLLPCLDLDVELGA